VRPIAIKVWPRTRTKQTGSSAASVSTAEQDTPTAFVGAWHRSTRFASLPTPPFTPDEKNLIAQNVYAHVWKQAVSGGFARPA
jgi:hypothetical protein